MPVSLFNKGKRPIHGVHPDKFEPGRLDKHGAKVPLKFVFKPETAMAFDDATASRLQRLFPGEVLSVQDVQKQFEPAADVAEEKPAAVKPAKEKPAAKGKE